MQMSQLQEVRNFARKYGVKSIVYGPPGSGKTPVANSAPKPVMLVTEPGMLSMRTSTVPGWEAYTWARIEEFFTWLKNSNERKNFQTFCCDSISQICEIYLREKYTPSLHGLKLYGNMSRDVGGHLNEIFFMPEMHTYLICKQQQVETATGPQNRPYFPGKDLNIMVPHLYDEVLQLGMHSVPGVGTVKAFRTATSFDSMARDRTGLLAEFEPPDLTALFKKCMSA